ncbi:MAG: nucleoside hydrolase [Bacteroidales bacterium]|nr:nucleoside hydrolase [Bacteroidales bacterium]
MIKRLTILVCFIFAFQVLVFAHSGRPKYHLIVDTDGAIDDFRAITMFLAMSDVRVLAITTSQGTLFPETSAIKVAALLQDFYNEGIPVGVGKLTDFELPVWSEFNKNIIWGENEKNIPIDDFPKATDLLSSTLKNYDYKVTLIALGALTTYADWLSENHDYISKVEKIIWYNDENIKSGFNYLADTSSFETIKKALV